MRLAETSLLLSLLMVWGCGEDAPLPSGGDAGVNLDQGVAIDMGTPDTGMPIDMGVPGGPRVEGRTLRLDSYLDGREVPVGQAAITPLGVQGVVPVASGEVNAKYSIEVPGNGQLLLSASKQGYLVSYQQVTVADQTIQQDFFMAYEAHLRLMTTAFGLDWNTPFPCHAPNQGQCRYALIMGRVLDDGSEDPGRRTPVGGVAKNDFSLSGEGNENWYSKGPYFFFYNGRPDANADKTVRARAGRDNKYQGGLFAYFVEVPANAQRAYSFQISARYGQRYFGPVQVQAFRSGFTWSRMLETGQNPPPPPLPQNVQFDTQIYPLFLPVAQGGYGCQGCHSTQNGAPSGGLDLSGGAAAAYGQLNPQNYPQRVNINNPAASYLLKRPLYEVQGDQDHPIFAFASEQDPGYQLIHGWISAGAKREGDVRPQEVSFTQEVYPLLSGNDSGCFGCHVRGVNAGNAPGGLYLGGTPQEMHQMLTQAAAGDNGQTGEAYRVNKQGNTARSLILTNPLVGNPEPHPAKLFQGTQDTRYQLIYRWISEGYKYDGQ